MRTNNSLLKIGHISRSHGIRGELFLKPLNPDSDWPIPLKEVFIGSKSYEVDLARPHKQGWIFKLRSVASRNESDGFIGQSVFLNSDLFRSRGKSFFYLSELRGADVELEGRGVIGKVLNFQSHPFQEMLVVESFENQKQILIPFVKAYILNLDFDKPLIRLSLPEGFPGL